MTGQDRKEKFSRFLIKSVKSAKAFTFLSEKTVSNYVGSLNTMVLKYLQVNHSDLNDIFEVSSFEEAFAYFNELRDNAEFVEKETNDWGNQYSNAMFQYCCFLNAYEVFHDTNLVSNSFDQPLQQIFNGALGTEKQILLTALRTKPFVLLAGISGTGKSRIVRELARACWKPEDEEYKAHKPNNYEIVQVKPNWHDSSDLLGYVSRISGKPEFVAGDFLKFVVKAWEEPETPYFICLDEMNLAPVEQYFAEYLSVIETRKLEGGRIITDPLLKKDSDDWYEPLIDNLLKDCDDSKIFALRNQFLQEGISIPQNLFVIGTVNMDETTFSFSRKVLDRAMTIEMNEVDLYGGLDEDAPNEFGYIGNAVIPQAVEGKDVYATHKELCDKAIKHLEQINAKLDNTPFKIAYRTRNEFLVYAVCRGEENISNAIDEMTSMKILSRIEGDSDKVGSILDDIQTLLESTFDDAELKDKSISLSKIKEMKLKLDKTQYTSFWS